MYGMFADLPLHPSPVYCVSRAAILKLSLFTPPFDVLFVGMNVIFGLFTRKSINRYMRSIPHVLF